MSKPPVSATRNNNINEFNIKLLLLGDTGVGKTCLLLQFTQNVFQPVFTTTIGIDFKVKYIDVEGLRTKLQIWDTAGQERFRTITVSYFRGAHAIMLLYDIGDRETFNNITQWMQQIHETLGGSPTGFAAGSAPSGEVSPAAREIAAQSRFTYENISILLVGNKSDVRYDDGQPSAVGKVKRGAKAAGGSSGDDFVTYEEGARLAAQFHNVEFMEVSAKDNVNINEAFQLIALMTKRRMIDKVSNVKAATPTGVADGKHKLRSAASNGTDRTQSTDSVNMHAATANKGGGCC